jgi:hypothetical protein
MSKKPIVAILYDFDSTLATSDMQNFGFIPSLGMTPAEFWGKTTEFSNKSGVERTLSYLYMMCYMTKQKGIKMTKEWLANKAKPSNSSLACSPGLNASMISAIAAASKSSTTSFLRATKKLSMAVPIAKEFKVVYACEFLFDDVTKEPIWPKLAINYTQKTQYFFRISKGVYDATDDAGVNEKRPDRRVPYSNIIYIGDGMTDIPAMIIAKNNGGKSIAVYPRAKKRKSKIFIKMAASITFAPPIIVRGWN